MDPKELEKVVLEALPQTGCVLVSLEYDEDENVITVTIDKEGGNVSLSDCETVHRAVLAAFDRDVEDYALSVTSLGIDAAEADEMLKEID